MYENEDFMADWSSDPLLKMLAEEGNTNEAEQTLSTELASLAVTKPHSGDY